MEYSKPLSGIKVVDFTTFVAAPGAAMLLGYAGADVIKVEPLKGDAVRGEGAPYSMPCGASCAPLYDTVNSWKKGIALNLRSKEGMDAMLRLIKGADVFISNYRGQALDAMGLDYDSVKALNPRIVYAHLDGYGPKGPDTNLMAFDSLTLFNRSGLAYASQFKGLPPIMTPYGAGDLVAALSLAFAIMTELFNRHESGKGSRVDTSLLSNGLWLMNCGIACSQFAGDIRVSQELFDTVTSRHYYTCGDGTMLRIFIGFHNWAKFCTVFECEEYSDDPRFCTPDGFPKNGKECIAVMEEAIGKKPFSYWDGRIKQYDLPIGRISDPIQAVNDEQAIANDFVTRVDYPELGTTVGMVMPPFKIEGIPEEGRSRGPKLGEDTVDVLSGLGFSREETDAMLAGGFAMQYSENAAVIKTRSTTG